MEAPPSLKRIFDSSDDGRPIDVRLLSDEPISSSDGDYFGFSAFAAALAEIIDNEETSTPLTIALSAPWGAGKTSVAKMIERGLEERVAARGAGKRIICEFNAWEHDDAPHLGAALAARVAHVANKDRRLPRRLLEPLPAAMLEPRQRWERLVSLGVLAAVLAGALMAFPPTRDLADGVIDPKQAAAGTFGVLWLAAAVWGLLYRAGRNATRFIDDPGSEAARGSIPEVKAQLRRLIDQATRGGRMLIVVDDLERCPAARAVEVFEVASQLLGHEGVVTLLLADMEELAEAAKLAYGGDRKAGDPELGRRYLEKLVQLELELPPPAASDMASLLEGKPRGPADAEEPLEQEDEYSLTRGPDPEQVSVWFFVIAFYGGVGYLVFQILKGVTLGNAIAAAVDFTLPLFGIALAASIAYALFAQRERRRRQRVAERVEATLEEHDAFSFPEGPEDGELAREAAGDAKYDELADRVAESFRTVKSPQLVEVEDFIRRYPPPYPRGAKRMLNHARLLTKIAREREMFGGNPELTPAHLGKWIVIGERWPAFTQQAIQQPERIREVENYGAAELPMENLPTDREFGEVMQTTPGLAEVLERLIYFKPARESDSVSVAS